MGAKMVIRTEFDEIALTRMEESGLSIEIGAQVRPVPAGKHRIRNNIYYIRDTLYTVL